MGRSSRANSASSASVPVPTWSTTRSLEPTAWSLMSSTTLRTYSCGRGLATICNGANNRSLASDVAAEHPAMTAPFAW
eukprot:916550-Pyramimonas_sp.AAC.1